MGHLAKADGRVSEDEIAQARAVMDRMQLDEEQRKQAIALFNRGKEADFPLQDTVAQFAHAVRFRKQLILVLLEVLLQIALADGTLHEEGGGLATGGRGAGRAAPAVPSDSEICCWHRRNSPVPAGWSRRATIRPAVAAIARSGLSGAGGGIGV